VLARRLKPFKHFAPSFPDSHSSLEKASALNVAFCFRKVAADQRTDRPLPLHSEPGAGAGKGSAVAEGRTDRTPSSPGGRSGGAGVKRRAIERPEGGTVEKVARRDGD
jgi:hypothetical protein